MDTEQDGLSKNQPEKVFDITPDLNISQASAAEAVSASTVPIPAANPIIPEPTVPEPTIPTPSSPSSTVTRDPWPIEQPVNPPFQPKIQEPGFGLQAEIEKSLPRNLRTATIGGSDIANHGTPGQIPGTNLTKPDSPAPANGNSGKFHIEPNLKPIRTYEGDVAELMSHKHISTATIAIAEKQKALQVEQAATAEDPAATSNSHALKNILLVIASLVLLGGGAAGAYYLYLLSPLSLIQSPVQTKPEQQSSTSIITADSRTVLPIDRLDSKTIIERIRSELEKSQSPNTIREIIPIESENGQKTRVSASDMLSHMDISAPSVLSRSLERDWMLGIYADQNENKSLFVIATNGFFQNTFAGMLSWEPSMPNDLRPYLQNIQTEVPPSSENMPSNGYGLHGKFSDRIIANKDVREFITNDGRILFLYSFIDNKKLVISGSESALAEIISRLEKQNFVR